MNNMSEIKFEKGVIPLWDGLPGIDLYMDQVITYMYKIIQDGIGVRLIDGAKLNMNTNSLFDISNYLTLTVNAD